MYKVTKKIHSCILICCIYTDIKRGSTRKDAVRWDHHVATVAQNVDLLTPPRPSPPLLQETKSHGYNATHNRNAHLFAICILTRRC